MRTVLRVFGECCVTAGAVVLLFLAYLVWGTALATSAHQHAFATQLQRQWQTHRDVRPATTRLHLVTGQPFAFIRIPRFGGSWRFAIVQGTGLPQLALGPGHVPGTALPGQVGNFAVAAHRVTAGNPFLTYLVTHTELVLPGDTAVLDPVPGHPHQPPREAMITLITCDPPWTGTHRIIVSGSLDAQTPRTGQHG